MDFKINKKRPSLSIPYERTAEDNESTKPNKCSAIFTYRTSFFALLLTITMLVCFVLLMIYVYIESTTGLKSTAVSESQNAEEEPFLLKNSLTIDPKTKNIILALENEESLALAKKFSESMRFKRQVLPNIPDCRGRQEECKIVLDGVRGITHSVHQKLDRLHVSLVQRGILRENDPSDVKFRKIVECLQCRNAFNNRRLIENGHDDSSTDRRNSDDRISDLLPFLENHVYSDDEAENKIDISEERNAKTSFAKEVSQEPALNRLNLASGAAKISIERDEDAKSSSGAREGSQVAVRNVDTTPIILPTAETTKTSQQIQFTPQSSWPSIPVCFYAPPSSVSSNSYQFKQTPSNGPFFPLPQSPPPPPPSAMYGQQGSMNQQGKFFYPNGQQVPFSPTNLPQPNFSPPANFPTPSFSPPTSFPPSNFPPPNFSPQNFPQTPMMMDPAMMAQRGNMPFYCTYIPAPGAPGNQQQPPFPFSPSNMADFQRQFAQTQARSGQDDEKKKPVNHDSRGKSTYDDSDEKYYVSECPGFWCNPPYKKCIATHERCDGKVDCMGAEDEIDCPYVGYYSRFRPESKQKPHEDRTETPDIFVGDIHWQNLNNVEETTHFVVPPTLAPNLGPPVTENEIETTTFAIKLPELPAQFTCKRIIQSIPLDKRCDNVYDCEDTSDEEGCSCKDYLRFEKPSAICDGHVDCFDGSDEKECGFCKEDQYHCHRSGGCIPKQKKCDQTMDCKLNEDELDCFALTDGHRVNLDLDKRPHLNLEGVLTRYDNGVWRPSCFKPEYRNLTKRMGAGQKICEYLGFKNVESAEEILVKTSKLNEKHHPVNYDYPPQLAAAKREANNTCFGLHIRCKPILDKKVNVHLRVDPKTMERSYLWPWEASILVDGKYHCSAVLLENDVLLSTSECSRGIDLSKNYTTATFGVASQDLPFKGAYQQTSQVIDIKPLKNSEASLFRLKPGTNMTRYVQPLYLEKRIFPAAKEDTCVALGVNDRHQRHMQFLQPVIDNCPKCHRCYSEKNDASSCSKRNETINWSGNVICLSTGGWYPAAVFQDKDQSCGFSTKQILNSIDYIHAHLSQAMDEKVEVQEEPICEGIRCALGKCIPWNRVCDGIRECKDGADESPEHCQKIKERCGHGIMECKCSKSELRCGNGKCVPKEMFCDGKVDCDDGSDEPSSCSCVEYLKLTEPKRVCDGRRHCLDKSDENYQNCLCKDSSFKCHKSLFNGTVACVPQDLVCDGENDCPLGEDEAESVCWAIKSDKRDPRGKGEVMRRDFGVLHPECFPRPIQTQREVTNVCSKLGYSSGLLIDGTKLSDSKYVARNDFYMFQLNNYSWLTMREDTSFGVWVKPESPCYRLFVQCF